MTGLPIAAVGANVWRSGIAERIGPHPAMSLWTKPIG
jgi:hypothetical protein